MDNTKTINVLSLCTGYGGLELGLSRALERVFRVVAVEVEAYALANLAAKAQKGQLAIEAMWPDLKTFPAERFRGCFDIILAGYPCQPFSVAGKRQGTDDPRHLWPYIERIIEAIRPVRCIFENVPGHLTIGFPEVYASLRNMGYSVEAGLFTAAEVGAPHKRQRLFIMGRLGNAESLCNRRINGYNNESAAEDGAGIQQFGSRSKCEYESKGSRRTTKNGQLADGNSTGCQEQCGAEPVQPEYTTLECSRWPSRPGQPQYEWEEPRVVADSPKQRTGREQEGVRRSERRPGGTLPRKPDDTSKRESSKGQTQSGVGRAVDGPSCRVDRLRLLGNGVVPQCAEKAIRELSKMFE